MNELKATITAERAIVGTVGALGNAERAEINAELARLLCENDPEVLETLGRMSIAGRIRFAQACRGNILNAIAAKGVPVPEQQPLRTVHQLIEQIGVEDGGQEPFVPYWETMFEGRITTVREVFNTGSASCDCRL